MDEKPQVPWVDWPQIRAEAKLHGWQLLSECRGVARIHRADARSSDAAVTLHIRFDHEGQIVEAWIDELSRSVGHDDANKLQSILGWLGEPALACGSQ